MSRWWKHCLLEMRLVLGNVFLAALPVLYAGIYLVAMMNIAGSQQLDMYSELYKFNALAHTLTLGPAMWLGILTVRRDIRRPSYEWNRSLPVSFHMLLSAKYAVGQLYMALFTIPAAVSFYAVSVAKEIDQRVALRYALNLALQCEVSYLVTFALAMLLGVCLQNRIVYLIGFCAWMFGTFFIDVFLIEQMGLLYLKTFHLSQFFVGNTVLAGESWGYELFKHEIGLSRRFVLAFTLLMLVVIMLLLNRSRPTMFIKRWWLLAVGALILAVVTVAPYASLWQTRYASVAERVNDPSVSWVNNDPRPWDDSLKVSQYDISLQRQKDDTLLMTAKLTVPAESRKGRTALPFTLHRSFRVNKVLVQGADAQYRRQGDFIDVELPQGTKDDLQIEIVYGGKIMDFSPRYADERYSAFSVGSEVNLPRYMAWYPLIGHQDLYFKDEDSNNLYTGITFSPLHYPPAKMKLTVEGYKIPLYTGIPEKERKTGYQRFEGDDVMGLSLFGSRDWNEIKHENLPVTIVTAPYDQENIKMLMKDLKKKYDYFASWVPELKKQNFHILYWGNDRFSYDQSNGNVENAMIISSENYYYNNVVNSLPGEWMNYMLFGSQSGFYMYSSDQRPEMDVRSRISSLFWYVYYRQQAGLSDKELVDGMYWTRSVHLLLIKDNEYDPKGIGRKMAKQVSRALRRGKEREVQEVLLHFYNIGLKHPREEENIYIKERPIPYKEWLEKWKEVMESDPRA